MREFLNSLVNLKDIESARLVLAKQVEITPNIEKAIQKCIECHRYQKRKSGIPYAVHPICVASIVAFYGGSEAMVCAALLHDVIEDTPAQKEELQEQFGADVASLVDALTKIVSLRAEQAQINEQTENHSGHESQNRLLDSALSFRKMLIASINDVRVFVIKICDRMHNMMTLDALNVEQQQRISKETLLVYSPIASRLGISSLKNELEDICFFYLLPDEYNKITQYLQKNHQSISLKLNAFVEKLNILLQQNGFTASDYKIESRVKRHYSIYLKMQRKSIRFEEILDLLAVRILVKNAIDCYKVLGLLHMEFMPVASRFKDYIAIPKENGYQTIHTSVFEASNIFEVQIRTFDMHEGAQYGVAAHWKYKSEGIHPNLEWLNVLGDQSQHKDQQDVQEFYELIKSDLYSEDIIIFSPKGDRYNLPMGAVALDFAYAIHSDIGNRAKSAYVNNKEVSLITPLKNSDIVRIVAFDTDKVVQTNFSFIKSVKTTRAKSELRNQYKIYLKEINTKISINMLATIFKTSREHIKEYLLNLDLYNQVYKVASNLSILQHTCVLINTKIKSKNMQNKIFSFIKPDLKLKKYTLENIVAYANFACNSISFNYCCHPKYGDEILALKNGSKLYVHHKLCNEVNKNIESGADMVFVEWAQDELLYQAIVTIEDKKGELARLLGIFVKCDVRVKLVDYDRLHSSFFTRCKVVLQVPNDNVKHIKDAIRERFQVIEFSPLKDAYS